MAAKNVLADAFEDQEFCDVKFVAEDRVIGAHKVILKSECQLLFDLSANWTPEKEPIPIENIECKSKNLRVTGGVEFDMVSIDVE